MRSTLIATAVNTCCTWTALASHHSAPGATPCGGPLGRASLQCQLGWHTAGETPGSAVLAGVPARLHARLADADAPLFPWGGESVHSPPAGTPWHTSAPKTPPI